MMKETSRMAREVVIGLDGGGTYTRSVAVDLDGNVLAYAQTGAANPSKTPSAKQHVRQAMTEVLRGAAVELAQVAAVVAGMAGLDSPDDQVWAKEFTELEGLAVTAQCVNDAHVAWAGAFGLRPGIVAIAGTGSIVFGFTEAGRQVRNYDFRHYGNMQARYLGLNMVHEIIAGNAAPDDGELVAQVLEHFRIGDISALAQIAATCSQLQNNAFVQQYSALAPLITQAAATAPLAQQVCQQAIHAMVVGIELVGSQFVMKNIPVALIGSVARSGYIQAQLREILFATESRTFTLVEPLLPPERGAALIALKSCGISPSPQIIEKLSQFPIASQ
jgi:glucosamine kinase